MGSSTLDYGLQRLQAVKTNDLIPVFVLHFFGQVYLYILETLSDIQQSGNTFFPSSMYDIATLSQTAYFFPLFFKHSSKPSLPPQWHCSKSAYGKFASVIITWTHLGMRLATSLVFPLNIFMISMHRRSRIRMNVFGTVQINPHKCSTTALEMHSAEM